MFLTRDKPQQWRFFTGGYWTAWTTTTTSLASQWGLLINIDSATGDIATVWGTFIEDEKYGFYFTNTANAVSAEFDTAVTRTWSKTLKASTTNGTWRYRILEYTPAWWKWMIPIKASTKYRFSVWIKSTNCTQLTWNLFSAPDQANFGTLTQRASFNLALWTTDWTRYTTTFTSHATDTIYAPQFRLETAGNISDIWIDVNSMTLEEVIEPVANSLVTPSPSLVSFTAVGSTDNIDTSLDPTFVAANTYTPPVAISEAAADRQTFVPTKSKLTRIWIYPVAKGTWNWTVTIHDASNVVQAVITIANASLTNGVVTYFNVPANVTALASYHFHVTSTVADGTVRVGTAADLETCSYIQNYYKPTTNFKASQNNLSVSVSTDEYGFLNGSVINFLTWAYSWNSWLWLSNYLDSLHSAFFRTDSYWNPTTGNRIISWTWSATLIYKLPAWLTSLILNFVSTVAGWSTLEISSSIDNLSYTVNSTWLFSDTCTLIDGARYIKLRALWSNCKLETLTVTWTVDVSSYSVLKNYPTNKDIIKQYATTLWAPTTSATYRATKWGFPAIEYSATEYQFLDVDTTATGSTVAFSELWTTYTTVADGASLAISSTSTPNIFVKANITANRIYSSSNDYSASSDKDGSLRQTLTYQVVQ